MGDSLNENLEKKMCSIRLNISKAEWENKSHIIFLLEAMYGSLLNKEQAVMIYDKLRKEDMDDNEGSSDE